MGHVRLGTLPHTRKWQQVAELLASGGDLEEIAAASSDAAERALDRAANDPAFAHAFWLLTQIPLAARRKDYLDQLWTLGLAIKGVPTLWDLVGAFSDAVDDHARSRGGRTDLGEMAQLAATESLTALASQERLATTAAHNDFNAALDQHCRETARIIREFSGDWFSKAGFEGDITPEKAKAFAHIAFRKIQAELRKRRDADG